MITDPIANYLTALRNALQIGHRIVEVPSTKMKRALTEILKDQGYISDFKEVEQKELPYNLLRITLKYEGKGVPVMRQIKRVSKPSLRHYVGKDEMPHVLNGFGISIVSTSKGLMTDKKARSLGIGGELICEIY